MASDDFNRADNADLGANWTSQTGSSACRIASNAARFATNSTLSAEYWNGGTPGDDQYAQAVLANELETITDDEPWFGAGVAVRMATGDTRMYAAIGSADAAREYELLEFDNAGVATVLGTYTGGTPALGDTLRIEAEGTTIRVLVNGVERISTTDATLASGEVGIAGGQNNNQCAVDDWDGASLITAELEQEGFRFRDDDGDEAGATWAANQDANHTAPVTTNLRLRILVNATDDPGSTQFRLDYKKSTDSVYVPVPLTATTGPDTPTLGTDSATESGNNTATGSWAVSHPDVAVGDLVIFCISWDDSTATTDVTEPAGPDSEVLSEVNATPAVSSNTACRAKVWYTIATDAWTAGTLTFTPSANEQWTAAVAVIPAGEFDATTPIGASTTHASAGVTETDVLSAAFSAGATDGDGRLFCWTAANQDPQTLAADWTQVANQDRGIVSGGLFSRDAEVTDSESIAEDTVSTIAGDDWCSVSFIVRAPPPTDNPIHVNASANITASGEATTAQLTAPAGKTTGDFVAGRIQDDENPADAVDITADDYTELEWCLTAQSGVATNGQIYQFRVTVGGVALDTYTVTPEWTIGSGTTSYTLTADAAAFSLSGQTAGLQSARKVSGATGAFGLTGVAAGLLHGYKVGAEAVAFALTGNDATLIYDATEAVLSAEAATFLLTGRAAGVKYGRRLTAALAAYDVTGVAAGLRAGRVLLAETGTFAEAPMPDVPTFRVTGNDADLVFGGVGISLSADAAAFVWSGQDAGRRIDRVLVAASGSFVWSGRAADLAWSGALSGGREFRPELLTRLGSRART